MPPRKPRLLEILWHTAAAEFTAVFDARLAPGVLDAPNWSFTIGATGWKRGLAVSAASRWVTGTTQAFIGGPAPDTARYDPPPFDVTSRDLVPLDAFADFPLTFLP